MKRVNIYTFAETRLMKESDGAYGYVIAMETSNGEATLSKIGSLKASENQAHLQCMIKALKRMTEKCELHIFTESPFLKRGIEEWLPKWKEAEWKTSGGKTVKNADEWQQLLELLDGHLYEVHSNTQHKYRQWLEREVKRRMNEPLAR